MPAWETKIRDIFSRLVPIPETGLDEFLSCWKKTRVLNRNDFLITKGQIETRLYFVIDGTMRIFFPQYEEEICVGFAYHDNLICSYPSFIKNAPSDYFIQALSKCNVVAIEKNDFYGLFDRHPLLERAWRLIEEEALVGKIERETEMLTFTPEQRYHRLMQRSPHIFQLIPKKYIASYLRMSPETLSRIRPEKYYRRQGFSLRAPVPLKKKEL